MNLAKSAKGNSVVTSPLVFQREAFGTRQWNSAARNGLTVIRGDAADDAEHFTLAGGPEGPAADQKTRIFLVDDHALIRRGLATLIGDESDMEVCGQADEAAAGLEQIIRLQPDLVIVDISLRGNSGLELIKNIKAHSPKIQILVLSMHDESVYALRALRAGARGYVMKQEDIKKVLEAIRRVRNGRLSVSPEIGDQMLDQFVAGDSTKAASPVACLSDRELEIMNLIGNGFPTREIATQLHVSVKTVETHRAHLKAKLNIRNATQLVQCCARWVEKSNSGHAPSYLMSAGAA